MKSQSKTVVAVAWFRENQWQQLRMLAADGDKLSLTYNEWKTHAEEVICKLQEKGVSPLKVDVELKDLQAWCLMQARPLDGAARADYAAAHANPASPEGTN